ncbi:hypothetical protein DM02DRAFT_658807 [Periconia macrospinosa]|uniref:Zn(2)-C6 fungal-type domain-containing protein n=1 Tax=Periconia macrospinosa TaxID=97972 RepID=A0A2V1DFH0_9PLEO|nr:hypothetical protein DM02DRAFT_658807 [Periconia macrospinosa]
MFLVLKPNSERAFVPYAPNSTGQSVQRIACLNCRAKKLRCQGQKTACDHCTSKLLKCVYPRNGNSDAQQNRKTKRARNKSDVLVDTQVSSAVDTIGPEPEAGPGYEVTNSPPINLMYEEFLDQSDAFDFERYWGPLEVSDILGDSSTHLIDKDLESSALHSSSISSSTNNGQAHLQDGQYDDFHPERSVSAGNSTSNSREAVGGEINPKNLISSNAHDSLEFPIIPESPHRMAPPSGSSQAGLEDSYQAAREQNLSPVSTLPVTCHCSSMVLDILKTVGGGSVDGETHQIHQALNMTKRTLDQLSVGVACQTCNYQSDLIMLITATFEKAIDSFDRSLKRYRRKITESERESLHLFFRKEDGSSPSGEVTQLCTPSTDRSHHDFGMEVLETISFGEYCVDQREEQLLLISVLVKCQIRELARFHSQIQALAARRKWEMHRILLEQVQQKIRALYSG